MRLREMLERAVKPRLHEKFGELSVAVPEFDDSEVIGSDSEGDRSAAESIGGLSLVLEYEDSRGNLSQRVITCRNYSVQAGKEYIKAFCHHRNGVRSFRIDRIKDIFDPKTGESLSPVQAFFAKFAPDKVTRSGLSWGLSVGRRADLLALLNALIFVARCDKEFHALERQSLENALTSFWIRLEIAGDPDFEDILNYADRLAPDGETFWVAMHRFREEPPLAEIFARHSRMLIEADGVVRDEEAYWALEIDEFLSET